MGLKKRILYMMLYLVHLFRIFMPQKTDRITFISITQDHPTQDFRLLYDALQQEGRYDIRLLLMVYEPSLKSSVLFVFHSIRQLYALHTSKLVILNDNNYVVTNFKPANTKVLQIWHACGAVKKFGNQIHREYPIQNYDYVIANAERWITPYKEAFGVQPSQVMITGMPRADRLCDRRQRDRYQQAFYQKYPTLQGKTLILYAPTFRGNIVKGLRYEGMDMKQVVEALDEHCILMYKLHPLLKDVVLDDHERLLNVFDENLYMLMEVSDVLISDYSSILFDYALLQKKMVCYASDMQEYEDTIGFNIDLQQEMPCPICVQEEDVIRELNAYQTFDRLALRRFQTCFMPHTDGLNTQRVIALIHEIMDS